MEPRQHLEIKPPVDVKAILNVDSIDVSQIDIISQAFQHRFLLCGLPKDQKEIFLNQWFKENEKNFYQQVQPFAKRTTAGHEIKQLANLLLDELRHFLIKLSDTMLYDQFEETIKEFCRQKKHIASRGRIADYIEDAKKLISKNYPDDLNLKKQSFSFWGKLAVHTYTPFERALYVYRKFLGDLSLLIGLSVAYHAETFADTLFYAVASLMISSVMKSGDVPLAIDIIKLYYKEFTLQPDIPDLKTDAELFKKNINQGIINYLLQQNTEEITPGEYPHSIMRDIFSVVREEKTSLYSSTSLVTAKLNKAEKAATPTLPPIEEVKSQPVYKDYEIKHEGNVCYYLQMKNKSYVKFDPSNVERQFASKKGPERVQITQSFLDQLREERELPRPAKSERSSKKSPFNNTSGKERLPGALSAYRLSYIAVQPTTEEKNLIRSGLDTDAEVVMQTPKNLVLHGRRGY